VTLSPERVQEARRVEARPGRRDAGGAALAGQHPAGGLDDQRRGDGIDVAAAGHGAALLRTRADDDLDQERLRRAAVLAGRHRAGRVSGQQVIDGVDRHVGGDLRRVQMRRDGRAVGHRELAGDQPGADGRREGPRAAGRVAGPELQAAAGVGDPPPGPALR
jgi:hypothetical protein